MVPENQLENLAGVGASEFPYAPWEMLAVTVLLIRNLVEANPSSGEVAVSALTATATQEANARNAAALAKQASCYAQQ